MRETLRGGGEHRNLVGAGRQSCFKALEVGHQHRVAHARTPPDAAHHLCMVSHAGHPFRRNERRRLDGGQATCGEPFHQLDLDCGINRRGFVLQPVAGADFDNGHSTGKLHEDVRHNFSEAAGTLQQRSRS